MADSAHPTDIHVGARIRLRRKGLGVSQQQLADSLGLTFQQVQKYERGANRVSASKLQAIAKTLQTPISYFFQGLDEHEPHGGVPDVALVDAFLTTPDGYELAKVFSKLPGPIRRSFLALGRILAAESANES
jgi:transcriptional regulator with XRE-family HTH domain